LNFLGLNKWTNHPMNFLILSGPEPNFYGKIYSMARGQLSRDYE